MPETKHADRAAERNSEADKGSSATPAWKEAARDAWKPRPEPETESGRQPAGVRPVRARGHRLVGEPVVLRSPTQIEISPGSQGTYEVRAKTATSMDGRVAAARDEPARSAEGDARPVGGAIDSNQKLEVRERPMSSELMRLERSGSLARAARETSLETRIHDLGHSNWGGPRQGMMHGSLGKAVGLGLVASVGLSYYLDYIHSQEEKRAQDQRPSMAPVSAR